MRVTAWCFLSTLELLQCLAFLSASAQAPAVQGPPVTPPALDDSTSFYPLFFPTAHPHTLLLIFGSSMSALSITVLSPDSPASLTQSSLGFTIEQIGMIVSDEPTGNTPDDYPNSSWAAPKFFSDLSPFNITHFASGRDNLEIVVGVTFDTVAPADDLSSWTPWTNASTMLQLFYPKDSVNPSGRPQGGSEFYAAPLDLRSARNVTFAYSVFFPSDFEWVKGGKLPGLYGGHTRCSGGNAALDCFSTRLMWRAGGAGELYLVKPQPFFSALALTGFRIVVRTEASAESFLVQRAAPFCMRYHVWALHCPGIFQVLIRIVDACQPDCCAQFSWSSGR